MKERFEGENRPALIDAIMRHEFVNGDRVRAEALAKCGKLVEFSKSESLIVEGADDNHVYLLLAGVASVVVKGSEVATRKYSQTVGEMAAMEPGQRRSATVVALETVVALMVSSADFLRIGEQHDRFWLPIARELSRRLYERNKLIPAANSSPKVFIISSKESLPIAHAVRDGLTGVFSDVWDEGVFFAGGYALEALELKVAESDFAIAIAEPEDIIESRGKRAPTLRDNVLFELGLFMGRLTRYRAFLIHPKIESLKLPSDLLGLELLPYEPGSDETLAARLETVCSKIQKLVDKQGVRTLTS